MSKKTSYAAANEVPYKLLLHRFTMMEIQNHRVPPTHLQLMPTNRCNLNCSFCSCGDRDKKLSLPIDELKNILYHFGKLGTQAVTITGGGEPLMHPLFSRILESCRKNGIVPGLVTNGLLLHDTDLRGVQWCRISACDGRTHSWRELDQVVKRYRGVDFAFSYVLGPEPDWHNIEEYVKYATTREFTHVRIVNDIMHPNSTDAKRARTLFGARPGVIVQDRSKFEVGAKICRVSNLRPVVAADGFVYPCCGSQYAMGDEFKDMPEEMRMCHWEEFPSGFFGGSVCKRCYYGHYNRALDEAWHRIYHEDFV